MPEGSWMSALPSAWKPQDPDTQVKAAQTGAQTVLTQAQAGQTAVAAEAANQDRIRKQALQDIMAQSIETTIGPDGKPQHHFSNDKFLGLLPTNKAAADAYAMWGEKINPANATAATQRALAGSTTAEGALDASALAKAAQGSEYAGNILAAGRGIQREQASTTTDIGANRLAQSVFSTPGTAQTGSLVGNEQITARQPTVGASSSQLTADNVSALTKADRDAAIYNLKAQGFPLPPNATSADIAAAANTAADNAVRAASVQGADLKAPLSYGTSAIAAQTAAPEIRQKIFGSIFGGALDIAGKKISNASARMTLEGAQAGKTKAEDVATTLRIPADRVGNSATQATQDKIDDANLTVKSYVKLSELTDEIQNKIKSGVIKPNTPEGNKRLLAETTAMIGQIQTIYGGAGTEGSVGRAMRDIGAPDDVVDAAVHGGIDKGLAAWLGNKQVNTAELLAGAPERAKASAILKLQNVYSADPEGVLNDAQLAARKAKRLAPSKFPQPGAAKPVRRMATQADIDALLRGGK